MSLADGRNLALMYFILIAIGAALGPGILLFFAIKGLRILKRKIVPYFHQIRFFFYRVGRTVDRASYMVAQPIIATASAVERMKFYLNRIANLFRQQEG